MKCVNLLNTISKKKKKMNKKDFYYIKIKLERKKKLIIKIKLTSY